MARGFKSGGRKKGSRNKRNQLVDLRAVAAGMSPLEYMLTVMRDVSAEPERRDAMAQSAAPYLHARRAAEDSKGAVVAPIGFYDNRRVLIDLSKDPRSIELARQLATIVRGSDVDIDAEASINGNGNGATHPQ